MEVSQIIRQWAGRLGGLLVANSGMRLFLTILIASPILVILVDALFPNRSFVIAAETHSLKIEFGGGDNAWLLPNARVCAPSPNADPKAPVGGCPAGYLPVRDSGDDRSVEWTSGTVVNLRVGLDGDLEITITNGGTAQLTEDMAIYVNAADWQDFGAYTFRGVIQIGEDMATGGSGYLVGGRWEARDAGVLTSWLRGVTAVVKSGEFVTGAAVTILDNATPAQVFGHFRPSSSGRSMDLTAVTQNGRIMLSERHFGVSGPTLIKPDIVDVLVSSPVVIAATVLVSILAKISQVLLQGRAQRKIKLGAWRRHENESL